mmetsp:Transcript_7091/g.6450  ORF Transcript_7091/g.6450 Transcript_7091/m.6450 type:complete len:80 (-) Transcript_7091:132-371(-)
MMLKQMKTKKKPCIHAAYTTQFWICWVLFLVGMPTTFIACRGIGKGSAEDTSTTVEVESLEKRLNSKSDVVGTNESPKP